MQMLEKPLYRKPHLPLYIQLHVTVVKYFTGCESTSVRRYDSIPGLASRDSECV